MRCPTHYLHVWADRLEPLDLPASSPLAAPAGVARNRRMSAAFAFAGTDRPRISRLSRMDFEVSYRTEWSICPATRRKCTSGCPCRPPTMPRDQTDSLDDLSACRYEITRDETLRQSDGPYRERAQRRSRSRPATASRDDRVGAEPLELDPECAEKYLTTDAARAGHDRESKPVRAPGHRRQPGAERDRSAGLRRHHRAADLRQDDPRLRHRRYGLDHASTSGASATTITPSSWR